MKETILVTGANGYLGWNLVARLAKLNDGKIICIDNYEKEILQRENGVSISQQASLSSKISLIKIVGIAKDIEHVWADVCDVKELENVFIKNKFSIVIHLAQQNSTALSMKNTDNSLLTNHLNTDSTINLLWCIHKYCPNALVLLRNSINIFGRPDVCVSEGKIYFSDGKNSTTMSFPFEPMSLMDCSKASASLYARYLSEAWRLNIVEFMQGSLYGFSTRVSKETLFAVGSFCYDDLFGTIVNRIVAQIVTKEPVIIHGSGEQGIGILSLDDAIDSYVQTIMKFVKKDLGFFGCRRALSGFYKQVNQITIAMPLNRILSKILGVAIKLGFSPEVVHDKNVRNEVMNKEYKVIINNMSRLNISTPDFEKDISELISDVSLIKLDVKTSLFNKHCVRWS